MINASYKISDCLLQGDVLKEVPYLEYCNEDNGQIEISQIIFPLVLVISQSCDLTWDYENRHKDNASNQDKVLFSAIVVPLYNYEHFIMGEHLSELGRHMQKFNKDKKKTDNRNLRQNTNPRYHYLEFEDKYSIVPSVIDFKHYFSVNIEQLEQLRSTNYICTVEELFRERISQRFAEYLSRIGLPEG